MKPSHAFLAFLSLLAMLSILLSCDTGAPTGQTGATPTKLSLHSPKGLFVGTAATSARAAGSLSDLLFEVLSGGDVQQVSFLDEQGQEVAVQIDRLLKLSDEYIGIVFTVNGGTYQVVAEMATGTLYDFSGYDLSSAMMRAGLLYVLSGATIYRIDFTSRTATAMNNPTYDPAGQDMIHGGWPGYPFIVVNDGNVVSVDNVGHLVIYFGDNSAPKDTGCGSFLWGPGGEIPVDLVLGDNGYLYRLDFMDSSDETRLTRLDFTHSGLSLVNFKHVTTTGVYYPVKNATSLYDLDRRVLFNDGYATMTRNVNGDFDLTFTAKAMPAVPADSYVSGPHLYSKNGDELDEMDLANDSAYHTRFTHSDIIGWKVVSNQVLFTAYITGTNIGTYTGDADGTVTLISNCDMAVRDVVEFSF